MLLTNRQAANLRKAFANKLSRTQLFKMIQSQRFLGRILGLLLTTGLRLMKNAIKPLAKIDLLPLQLIAVASVADPGIHKKS